MAEAAAAGIEYWEPFLRGAGDLEARLATAERAGLGIRSAYFGARMHEKTAADEARRHLVAIATEARGTTLSTIVANPDPIRWGGLEDKTDAQLAYQAGVLAEFGAILHEASLTLCYHTHDAEMRQAAREFHHMLLATPSGTVRLALDAHWVWRGAGNSMLALLDIVRLYGARIGLVHLRQSRDGIWAETVEGGDIDYRALAAAIADAGVRPLLTIEHAVEAGTASTLSEREAHRRSAHYIRELFARPGA
jgi:inosose dehydratase